MWKAGVILFVIVPKVNCLFLSVREVQWSVSRTRRSVTVILHVGLIRLDRMSNTEWGGINLFSPSSLVVKGAQKHGKWTCGSKWYIYLHLLFVYAVLPLERVASPSTEFCRTIMFDFRWF